MTFDKTRETPCWHTDFKDFCKTKNEVKLLDILEQCGIGINCEQWQLLAGFLWEIENEKSPSLSKDDQSRL